MSKRKLLQLVQQGHVSGWNDPRMPTISGLRRRGYTPESIRDFCARIGVAKKDNVIDMAQLEHSVREDLNRRAPRVMTVLRPLKVVLTNYPEGQVEEVDVINNPEDASAGTRKVPFSRELYIERDDFMEDPPKKFFRLSPGKEVRLRCAYFITCTEVVKDDRGEIVELRCTYDPATRGGDAPDGRRVKATLHWVSAAHAVPVEVRLYDRLFSVEDPENAPEGKTFLDYLNPHSLEVLTGARRNRASPARRPARASSSSGSAISASTPIPAPARSSSTARCRCATPGRRLLIKNEKGFHNQARSRGIPGERAERRRAAYGTPLAPLQVMDARERWQALQARLTAARAAVDAGDRATALAEISAALELDKDFLAAQALRDRIMKNAPTARTQTPLRPHQSPQPGSPRRAPPVAASSGDASHFATPPPQHRGGSSATRSSNSARGGGGSTAGSTRRRAAIAQQSSQGGGAALDEVIELDPNLPELAELTAQFDRAAPCRRDAATRAVDRRRRSIRRRRCSAAHGCATPHGSCRGTTRHRSHRSQIVSAALLP